MAKKGGFPRVEKLWFNGRLVPWGEARVHVLTHGLHYGTGVFEGIRCYATPRGSLLFRVGDHLDRMVNSARIYKMRLPYSKGELEGAVKETIRANRQKSCYVRPIAFYGYYQLGVHPGQCPVDVAVATWPWDTYLGAEGLESGIRCTISSWVKMHSSMIPTAAKATGQYLNALLAKVDAIDKGFDEAIMVDHQGFVSEGPGENIFMVRHGSLYTPGLEHSILPGVTRDTVIQLARDLGVEVVEKTIGRDELLLADEVFFTGTAAEVTPIREIDQRPIGGGRPGPLTKRIQAKFFDVVNARDERYLRWLEPVY